MYISPVVEFTAIPVGQKNCAVLVSPSALPCVVPANVVTSPATMYKSYTYDNIICIIVIYTSGGYFFDLVIMVICNIDTRLLHLQQSPEDI